MREQSQAHRDGEALHALVASLPPGEQLIVDWVPGEDGADGGWMARASRGRYPEPPPAGRPWATGEGATVAEACDAARAQMEGA